MVPGERTEEALWGARDEGGEVQPSSCGSGRCVLASVSCGRRPFPLACTLLILAGRRQERWTIHDGVTIAALCTL